MKGLGWMVEKAIRYVQSGVRWITYHPLTVLLSFNRGENTVSYIYDIGIKTDTLLIDNSLEQYYEKFILHYNFLPFLLEKSNLQEVPEGKLVTPTWLL